MEKLTMQLRKKLEVSDEIIVICEIIKDFSEDEEGLSTP